MKSRFTLVFLHGILLFIFSITHVSAQIENAAYSATGRAGVGTTMLLDYQCLGVNPANIAIKRYEGKHFTIGILEGSANSLLQGMSTTDLSYYLSDAFMGKDSFNYDDRQQAAQFVSGNAINLNIDMMGLGLSYNNDKIGSFAFSVKESIRYFMDFNETFTDYAFNGSTSTLFPQLITNSGDTVANDPNQYQNYFNATYGGIKSGYNAQGISLGTIVNNTSYKLNWSRDWTLGYSKKIIEVDERHAIYAGIAVKYVQGFGYVDLTAKDNKLTGVAAYMPALNSLDSILKVNSSSAVANSYKSIGQGMGFDFGLTAQLFNNFRVGASLINIGSMTYTQNVNEIQDTTIYTVKFNPDLYSGFEDIIKWKQKDNFKVALPSQFRLGASVHMLSNRIEVGFDMVAPLNKQPGNYNTTAWAVGGDFFVLRWLKLATGMSWGGNYASTSQGTYKTRVAVPFGIGFVLGEEGGFEFGFATKDITTYFMNQTSPLYSAAIGTVRIRI